MKQKSLFVIFSLITILSYGYFAFAAAPLGGYNPGDTLNPDCAPGDVDCVVTLPSGGSVTADNGLTVTGSNVQLGGVLLSDTTITTTGREFVVQGTNSKLVSGADPLGLFPLIGEAYPGVGISTDGTLTGGVKSYIGSLINPSNSKSLTVLGNFDIANGIQAAMVAEDNELNIYSSDGVSGSSNVSLSPGSLSLYSNDGIDIYADNYIRFGNFGSSRDDSGTNFPTNFLYTDGSGNLQSAPTSLLGGGGGSSLSSQDEGTLLTSTTTGYNFIGAGVTATESGGLVTVNIPGGGGGGLTLQTNGVTNTNQSLLNLVAGTNVSLADDGLGNITINAAGGGGGGADGSIYLNDGTLTGNRTLNGGGFDLLISNTSKFGALAQKIDSIDGQFRYGGLNLNPGVSTEAIDGVSLFEFNTDTGLFSSIIVDDTKGLGFSLNNTVGTSNPDYWFPVNDGTANQVLTTDGLGQLSWQNGGGGSGWSLTGNSGTTAGTNFIGTTDAEDFVIKVNGSEIARFYENTGVSGSSVGLGGGIALDNNMFVYGSGAGVGATDASFSNFIGIGTGNGATNASSSNFIGRNAGSLATDAVDSNFFGTNAGDSAANAEFSNFFGRFAGSGATDATFSNFFGRSAGLNAANASLSNFFGYRAGQSATDAGGSNFFGYSAGEAATNASLSNFIGYSAGLNATNAANSIFIGQYAGNGDSVNNTGNVNDFSILIGKSTSTGGFENSIAIGGSATNTASNQFMIGSATRPINDTVITGTGSFKLPIGTDGQRTGSPASGMVRFSSTNDCYEGYKTSGSAWSCFSTGSAGWSLTGNSGTAAGTNFIGTTDAEDFVIKVNNIETGRFTNNTEGNQYSVFLGNNAGVGAIGAHRSNFFGRDSGGNATYASGSNFLGELSGYEATNAGESNFIGSQSGRYATNASNSNFFGSSAGYSATEANNSIFIGRSAGSSASFAANSIFLGQQAGESDTVNNTGNLNDFSILIGKSTSTGGFSNSIALGANATNTSSNQFMIGSTTRPIDETKIIGSLGTECTITTGTGMACTSDERLKTNITDLNNDTLTKLQNVRTVSYNWLQNPDSPLQIGFLAQNLEQYFPEMVMTDPTGKKQVYYSQMTPILTKAIQEMNLKITDIGNMDTPNTWRDSLIAWFGNLENGITELFAGRVRTHELCLDDLCVTKDQLQQMLQNSQQTIVPSSGGNLPTDPDPIVTPDDTVSSDSNPIVNPDDSGDSNSDTPTADTPTE